MSWGESRRHLWTRLALALTFAGCLALAALAGWWVLTGGRWMVMTTPSMSPRIPVGALVVTRAVTAPPRPGSVVAFVPPGQTVTFVHEIVGGNRTSGYLTKGLLDSHPDPWRLPPSDISGTEVIAIPVLGWVARGLPWLLAAVFLWWSAGFAFRWRTGRELSWLALIPAATVLAAEWKPLINAQVVAAVVRGHRVHVFLVSTGVLPERISFDGRPSRLVAPGHPAWFSFARPSGNVVGAHLWAALDWWELVLLALLCTLPLLLCLRLIGRVNRQSAPPPGRGLLPRLSVFKVGQRVSGT